jgi:hypothetical protein
MEDLVQNHIIEITVDKSHLITIGERLYRESVDLVRELINNAYDADATSVWVEIKEDEIRVKDNGTGMDLEGLKQYFNIGSPLKRLQPKSPKFGRARIGEFGIGKFSVLSCAPYFEVRTKKKDFSATVIFDKEEWEKSKEKWNLPLIINKPDPKQNDGTEIIIKRLKRKFDLSEIERKIIESCPIKQKNFSVYLNGKKIKSKFIPGHRIPFIEGTSFGPIFGEIIIQPASTLEMDEAGIQCKVKQVTIKKEFFGLEELGEKAFRITGEVNADFLPITSGRNDFIKDSLQYKEFLKIMHRVIERVKQVLKELSDYKINRAYKRRLTEVMDKIKKALVLNPDLCPEGLIPFEETKTAKEIKEQTKKEKEKKEKKKKTKKKKPKVKTINPTAVIKKLKYAREGITCCIDHFGKNAPECFSEGYVVYINRDHPLFEEMSKSKEAYIFYIARLITQEITLLKSPRNPRQAFQYQSRLLKDAFKK